MQKRAAVGKPSKGIFNGFNGHRHRQNRFHIRFGKHQWHERSPRTMMNGPRFDVKSREMTRKLAASKIDVIAKNASSRSVENQKLSARTDGRRRRRTPRLPKFRRKIHIELRAAIQRQHVKHASIGVHYKQIVARNRELIAQFASATVCGSSDL